MAAHSPLWAPGRAAPVPEKAARPATGPSPENQGDGGLRRTEPPGRRPPGRRRKRRRVILTVLLVLLALLAVAFVVHQIFVRPPDVPPSQSQSMGTDPGSLGAGRKEGVYTFLLVGRDDGGGGNTDTIMVGCYDVKNGAVDVLSIYRDTLVDVPWEIAKINSVYNRQGIEGVQQQVKNLIGYVPDYYFVVELDAVAEIVDTIGGVDYDVPYNMDYDDPTQDLHIHYKKGMQHLNGEDAVKVLRWRKNNSGESLSVGDVGRVEVQHTFLRALAGELVSLGTLTKIGELMDVVDRNLESNLSYGEMIWFGGAGPADGQGEYPVPQPARGLHRHHLEPHLSKLSVLCVCQLRCPAGAGEPVYEPLSDGHHPGDATRGPRHHGEQPAGGGQRHRRNLGRCVDPEHRRINPRAPARQRERKIL